MNALLVVVAVLEACIQNEVEAPLVDEEVSFGQLRPRQKSVSLFDISERLLCLCVELTARVSRHKARRSTSFVPLRDESSFDHCDGGLAQPAGKLSRLVPSQFLLELALQEVQTVSEDV